MIAAAREAGVFLMTAYRLHNEPGTVAVLEHIRNDAIGRPLFFQSVFSFQAAAGESRELGRTADLPQRLVDREIDLVTQPRSTGLAVQATAQAHQA